jgi:SMC interacting uncharacterized protein involved in chromosome segregation
LAEDVRRQNLSPEEVARMFRDRDTLEKQLKDLSTKQIELQEAADELSVAIFRQADEAEGLVDENVNLLYKLNLHPKPPPPFEPGEFLFTFNRGTDDLNSMITGADISIGGDMAKKLVRYAEKLRAERAELANEAVILEHDLENAVNDLEELQAKVKEIAKEVENTLDDLKNSKFVSDSLTINRSYLVANIYQRHGRKSQMRAEPIWRR